MIIKQPHNQKWFNWIVLNLAFMFTFFHRFSTSAIANTLMEDLGLTNGQLANLASAYFYSYALMQIPVGILIDRLGPKKISATGMLLCAIGAFITSMVDNIYMLYLCRALIGIGCATLFISIIRIQMDWFKPSEFTKLTGFTSLIANIGGLTASAPLTLVVTMIGWRKVFSLISLLTILIFIIIIFVVREKSSIKNSNVEKEEDRNEIEDRKGKLLSFPFIALTLSSFSMMGASMSFQGLWGIPYLQKIFDISKGLAATVLMSMSCGILVACILVGYISKKFKDIKKILLVSIAVFAVSWLFIVINTKILFLTGILLFIMAATGNIVFVFCISYSKQYVQSSHSALGVSIIDMCAFVGAIFFNTVIGKFLDIINSTGNMYSFVFLIYLLFAGFVLILVMNGLFYREQKC